MPRPPSSTLFPYTTLFRSHSRRDRSSSSARCHPASSTQVVAAPSSRATRSVSRDRKSTRLNSSHVEISYAVFCLKKKKKEKKQGHRALVNGDIHYDATLAR